MKATMFGLVLIGVAAVLTAVMGDLEFLPYLLLLLGGLSLGFAFVGLTFRMPRNGLFLHIAGAVVAAATVYLMVEHGTAILALLPEWMRGLLIIVQLAAIPATGWILLTLLSRATSAIRRRDRAKAPARTTPSWERDERADGSFVSIRVVEMRTRRLTLLIVSTVVVVGAIGVALLIAFDDVVSGLGPRFAIFAAGLVLGFPAYIALASALHRRTQDCTVAFGNDEVRIAAGQTTSVIRFSDLERLLWSRRGDYARVEVRGAGVDLSLLTGVAQSAPGRTGELPELPRRVFTRLEKAGFVHEAARGGDVVTFRRTVSL